MRATASSVAYMLGDKDLYDTVCDATNFLLKLKEGDAIFTVPVEWMFPSGIVFTTPINGLDNLMFNAYVFMRIEDGLSVAEAYGDAGIVLGFKTKLEETPHHYQQSFLKKWPVPTMFGTTVWINLPSMILKACKTLNNPCTIFKETDRSKALYKLAGSIGASWLIPNDYPIFGTFLERCRTLGTNCEVGSIRSAIIEDSDYKMFVEYPDGMIDREEVFSMISKRYSVSVEEAKDLDAQVAAISAFPWSLEHHVLEALLQDY